MPPRWARAADLGTVGLSLVAVFVALTGGFRLHVGILRLAVTEAWRVAALAAAVAVVRHIAVPRPSIYREMLRRRDAWRGTWWYSRLIAADRPVPLVSRPVDWRFLGAVFGIVAVVAAATTFPQVLHLRDAIHDPGDPLLNLWTMAWVAHVLPTTPAALFDANIFAPERFTLAYSETLLAPAVVAVPLLWAGVHSVLVYNLLFLAGFVASGTATALLVLELTGSRPAALVAGVVFAALPFRFDHFPQLQLQHAEWIPLAAWALHRVLWHGRMGDAIRLGVFVAAQVLSCVYYGVYLSAYLVIFGGVLLLSNLALVRTRVPRLVAAAAITVALLFPVGGAYLGARTVVGERGATEAQTRSATWRSYLAAPAGNWLYGWTRAPYGGEERNLFPGIVAVALAAVALWPPWSPTRLAYAAGLAFAFNLTLGFNAPLYTFLWDHVPPFRALRIPALAVILVGFSIAVLAGFGVARLTARTKSQTRAFLAAGILSVAVLAEACAMPMRQTPIPDHAPEIYADLVRDAGPQSPTTIVDVPMLLGDDQIYMYYSTFHWQRLVNGYSGFFPPSYLRLVGAMHGFPDAGSLEALRARGVRYAVLHGEMMAPAAYARSVDAIDACRCGLTLVARRAWQDREMSLYRIDAPAP